MSYLLATPPPAETLQPPLDIDHLWREVAVWIQHERTFAPGRANTYDAMGNEIEIDLGK